MGCISSKDVYVVNVDGKAIACTRNEDNALRVFHRMKDKPNVEVLMYLPDEKKHVCVTVIHNRPYVRKPLRALAPEESPDSS